jgi:hypothetical protein
MGRFVRNQNVNNNTFFLLWGIIKRRMYQNDPKSMQPKVNRKHNMYLGTSSRGLMHVFGIMDTSIMFYKHSCFMLMLSFWVRF